MKTKKFMRLIALIMSMLLLVTVLAACSSSDSDSSSDASDSESSDSAEVEDEAETEAVASSGATGSYSGKDIDNDPIKLAFIALSTSGVTNVSYETAFAEQLSMYDNVTLTYFDGEYNPTTQNDLIQECITQEYDCIILEGSDGEALSASVLDAEAAGIPVVSVNATISGVHSAHIQGNDYASGQQGAQYLYDAIGDGGNYIILDCPAAVKANTRMGTGADDWFAENTDWTKLDHQYIDDFSQENANTAMRDLLTKYDNIDAVYCSTDDIAMGAIQAIQAAGRDGILVWGNTGYYNAFEAIADGSMYGTSWCDVYSQFQAITATALWLVSTGINSVNAGFTETPIVNCAMIAVTQDNVDQLLPLSRWTYTSDYL